MKFLLTIRHTSICINYISYEQIFKSSPFFYYLICILSISTPMGAATLLGCDNGNFGTSPNSSTVKSSPAVKKNYQPASKTRAATKEEHSVKSKTDFDII